MTFNMFSLIFLGLFPPLLLLTLARFDREHDLPNPLRVVAWTLILGYSLKSLYLAYATEYGLAFRTDYFTSDYIYFGQLMVLLASVVFSVGYALTSRVQVRLLSPIRVNSAGMRVAIYWSVFLIALLGVALSFYLKGFHLQLQTLSFAATQFFVSDVTGTRSSLGFLLLGADILVVFFLYYIGLGGKPYRPNIYLPAIIFVALNYFLSSQRLGVLIIIIASVLVGRVSFFNLKSKVALRRLGLVGLIVVVLSTSSFIRQERRSVDLSEIDIMAGVETTLEHAFEGTYALDPAKLTGIALRHDDFLYGQSFAMFIVAPIPRVLWPEKPNVRLGPYVAQEILDYRNNSGAPPSAIGEFYINFGWLGIIVGMLGLGVIAALLPSIGQSATSPEIGRVRYGLALMVLILFLVGDFSYAALYAIKYGFAAVVCEAYWRARLKPSREQAAAPNRATA